MIDWDAWRSEHASMTFADQQEFYGSVAVAHPHQQCFDLPHARSTFDHISGLIGFLPPDWPGLNVIELGGWDGALADALVSRDDISSWTNYDLAEVPQVCTSTKYRLEVLSDYFWNRNLTYVPDVFVACHTIEHLTGAELEQLFDVLQVKFIYLQAPIVKQSGQTWNGYVGSHILELGWDAIDELLVARGYVVCGPHLWRQA
jgi:hypothetical protein